MKKLFLGSAVVLVVGAVAFASAFTMARATVTPEPIKAVQSSSRGQPCCMENDCCLECILCCAIDGGCEECYQCCIEMGCDPSCCFPGSTGAKAEAPKTTRASCDPTKGCCAKPVTKAKACNGIDCCK